MSMIPGELSVLKRFEDVLRAPPNSIEPFKQLLDELNPIVIKTAQDQQYQALLASSLDMWKQLRDIVSTCNFSDAMTHDEEYHFWYLRCTRGIMLLIRNISVANHDLPQQVLIQNAIIRMFNTLTTHSNTHSDMEQALFIASLTALHNVTKVSVIFDKTMIDPLVTFLEYPIGNVSLTFDLVFPYVLLFENLLKNEEFLYYLFRHESKNRILFDFVIEEVAKNNSHMFEYLEQTKKSDEVADNISHEDDSAENDELSGMELALLRCFRKIISHESFAPYLLELQMSSPSIFFKFLKIAQIISTSIENWDKYELTGIMTWCFTIFEKASKDTIEYFATGEDDIRVAEPLHQNLTMTLDIMSSLSRYEHVQKYINSYDGLAKLIELLGALQTNLIRINFLKDASGSVKNLKVSDSMGNKVVDQAKLDSRVDYATFHIMATNFPECKLLLIETLANICYKKKEMQDQIRTLHGLELVLSNCVIDDNDPFIKERSIVCIKFLLDGNEENQKFVASMEAKKAVDDETLSQAGYEVDIGKDGGVKLQPKKST
ncbi:Ctr86 protein [Maudiozyma humilis]|uniref:Ataxin-10 homolog n=1 Tax=Maudiozyma humilis TaxID=51915 RepID=A0AAV5RRV0_MAUHU|nr:Ctr86 protein [Kazachstania humilis]